MSERRGQEMAPKVQPPERPNRAPDTPPPSGGDPRSGEVLAFAAGRWRLVRVGEVRVTDRRRIR